ncbi:ribosomal protein S18-alanine N-acetyltransferase [Tepidimicrobium xylanilyticum]|uniref:[Ribosomal protein bS18]-alanine N-acetyltransferase n=1 Tax=Tepidimicrobium xylanilyticum TaxID=1123352 RepID=A0A1H2QDU8_9FIRM|nr:ribosomal protein S18-alanine N-acetyltransferase [Tepidimicrobium xylanilyticum]GMG95679.1 ribosomal-protein-alanine acetyltransferase [Tepidimicrobium xylanilyticum]SDW05453.1 [SSU ribosomal protein S18P]-alanine acetyltransferase [Tepidimicrobium xylanilyticum]
MEISIREMREEDLDRVMEIEAETFNPPWSREAFLLELTKNILAKYIVVLADGEIAGYGGVWLIIDEGHITNIAIDKKYRGLGLGKALLEGLIQICVDRNIRAITLEVRKSNEVAKSLYKKYGFIEYGIRPNYYHDNNEDAIIMWKSI